MRSVNRRVSCLALVLAAGFAAAADNQGAADRVLELKVGTIDTRAQVNLLAGGRTVFAKGAHYVLQLDGAMTAEREAALRAAGVTFDGYLPVNAYIVRLDGIKPQALNALGFVAWVGDFKDQWKLDPQLGRRMLATMERRAQAAAGTAKVVIETFADIGPAEVQAHIAQVGGAVISSDPCGRHWLIEATIPAAMVPGLAALPTVQFVEDAVEIQMRNDSNRWILQSNVSNQTPVWNQGIHGEGQIAGLIDGTVRETHCMFDDTLAIGPTHRKIVAARGASGTDSHGTHTAGTIAGDNLPYGSYTTNDGLAYAAKLSTTNLNTVTSSNLITNLNAAHADGARCHSNSWGDDGTTAYTSHCQQIDQFTYANEDNLVAFAVTNLSALKTPENSVNVLAVGASQDSPNQGNHCSGGTGPTADGRRKPEIYAPGCNTTSASLSTCSTANSTGTSMACPAITGAAVLVRQYFTAGYYPTGTATPGNALTPTGALIKAVLLNGTVDMTGPAGYPSNQEGFGRLILDNALFFPGDARDLNIVDVRNANGLTTGQQTSYPINVVTNGQPLRITMVFTAPAAAVNAANPVINNLDLEVSGPGGLYRGNVFTAGQSVVGGTADAKNNLEMVILNAPTPGTYTVTIKGTTVAQGTQGYALAISGDLGSACTGAGVSSNPSNQNVEAGAPASFSVVGSGTGPLSYQWRRNTVNLVDNARITGSNLPTLNISSALLSDAGSYDVIVSNSCGSTPSAAATLGVSCYANCDGSSTSPILTANDFACFLNSYASGESYANCDQSVGNPTLTANDFQCFLNKFANGCS
jgi:hypothetical protein